MRKLFSTMFFILFVILIPVDAQDIVQVPPGRGTLNDAILANGVDGKIFQLQRGGRYATLGRITTFEDQHLQIISEPAPSSGEDPGPAVIWNGVRDDGTVDQFIFELGGSLTLKNTWVLSWNGNDARAGWTEIIFNGANSRIVLDNCIFEWNPGPMMEVTAGGAKIYVTNTVWRNMIDPTQWWAGRMIYINTADGCDSVIVENNTFVNLGFVWQNQLHPINYFWWNHNTVVNCAKFSLQQELATEAYITNNIWVNSHFTGERLVDRPGQDPDGLLWGAVLIVDTLNPATSLFPEEDRKIVFWWNNHYLDPAFNTFYQAYNDTASDPILPEPFPGNERTMDMFNWHSMMKLGGVYDNENPNFTAPPDNINDMIAFLEGQFVTGADYDWGWDPDDAGIYLSGKQNTVWPLPENLTYSNATLLSGGYGGFPLGDLRWFPDQRAAWEAQADAERAAIHQIPLSVRDIGGPVPTEFALKNAYPNPFNPNTNIEFVVGKSGNIELTIFNAVGQKIRTLYSGSLPAGSYNADWDGKDANGVSVSSGIYFYQLKAGSNFVETKKMMLMK
jgi:hypothetical protein